MKDKVVSFRNVLFVIVAISLLSGCATLNGFSGKDKGAEKIADGVEKDLQGVWDAILAMDAKLREKLW